MATTFVLSYGIGLPAGCGVRVAAKFFGYDGCAEEAEITSFYDINRV